nr:MAG TPA: hypothetical protein [Caudoviricetes sp.]
MPCNLILGIIFSSLKKVNIDNRSITYYLYNIYPLIIYNFYNI